MIYYPIIKIRDCGIRKVLIVTGKDLAGSLVGLLGGGNEFGMEISYRIQEEAGGIAQALGMAESFAGSERSRL